MNRAHLEYSKATGFVKSGQATPHAGKCSQHRREELFTAATHVPLGHRRGLVADKSWRGKNPLTGLD